MKRPILINYYCLHGQDLMTNKSKMAKKKNLVEAVQEPVVMTFDGTSAVKSKCRRIGDDYYIIGNVNIENSGQVYFIDGTWYRINTQKIGWDNETKKYSLISSLMQGIVDVKNYVPVIGYFTPDRFKNIACHKYGINTITAISEEVALKLPGAVRDIQLGRITWHPDKGLNGLKNPGLHSKQRYASFDTSIYGYNNNSGVDISMEAFNEYIEAGRLKIGTIADKLAPYLKQFSFGAELETCYGTVPECELFKNALIPVKDGSIPGHEYITIPHEGAIGLQALMNATEALSNWTGVNQACSLHIHVGNVPRDKEFIISMYMLCYMLQHELHEVVAPYKKDVHYLANKNQGAKDHCKYLTSLEMFRNKIYSVPEEQKSKEVDATFERIFTWLNDGNPASGAHNFRNGKHVRQQSPKWEWRSRYYWFNFCNLVFSNNKTVENRLHSGTVNTTKTLNWLLITIAMVNFALNNQEQIIRGKTKYSLEDIINWHFCDGGNGDVIANYLNEYILNRKSEYFNLQMREDMYGNEFENRIIGFQDIKTLESKLK